MFHSMLRGVMRFFDSNSSGNTRVKKIKWAMVENTVGNYVLKKTQNKFISLVYLSIYI